MSESIYGYTEVGANYPAYVNYSRRDGGEMILTVRSSEQPQGSEIQFPLCKFWDLVAAVGKFHLPADIEFVPSILVDELEAQLSEAQTTIKKLQEENARYNSDIGDLQRLNHELRNELSALRNQASEPVAWRRIEENGWYVYYETNCWGDLSPLYAAPVKPDHVKGE